MTSLKREIFQGPLDFPDPTHDKTGHTSEFNYLIQINKEQCIFHNSFDMTGYILSFQILNLSE